ncbi:MAG: hypothetical protein WD875_00850 [Pirellulales bacterium]
MRHDYSFTEEDAKNLPEPSENPSLVAMFPENLSAYLDLTRALRDDAYVAAEDGDGRRMTANLIAMFDLAEQVHEAPFIVDEMVATTIAGMATSAIGRNLAESAEAFRDEDFSALTARLQRILDEQAFRIRTNGDEAYYADSIQRYYTDDGGGDGVFTIDGDWSDEDEQSDDDDDEEDEWLGDRWDRFRVPIWAALVMPGRSELAAANERYHRELDRVFRLPPWERDAALADFVDEVPLWMALRKWDSKSVQPEGYVYILKRVDAEVYQYVGGVLSAIAAVRHQRINHQWPTSLEDVVPKFLREVPIDQFTGRPLHYKLIDGKPVVYSVSADLDDDGGQSPELDDRGSVRGYDDDSPADGDWILWPPIESGDADEDADGRIDRDRDDKVQADNSVQDVPGGE